MWYIGQEIVCVDDFPRVKNSGSVLPKKGNIYTIRDIHFPPNASQHLAFLLEEISTGVNYRNTKIECGYLSTRFHPKENFIKKEVVSKEFELELGF